MLKRIRLTNDLSTAMLELLFEPKVGLNNASHPHHHPLAILLRRYPVVLRDMVREAANQGLNEEAVVRSLNANCSRSPVPEYWWLPSSVTTFQTAAACFVEDVH